MNAAGQANKYLNQIPGQTAPHYDPWENAGKGMIDPLTGQYTDLMNNPGGKYNEIGQNFHESPGFKFALEQALQSNGNTNAAGGMAGSPMHAQQNMATATGLANQDYYNYMQGATGLYGEGLHGAQGMANQGQQAGQSQAEQIAQTLAQKGNAAFQNAQQHNQNKNDLWGTLGKGLGAFSSFTPYGSAMNMGQMGYNALFGK